MARQQERSEETRTRLLDSAQECFARRGYDATGVAEICRRAKLSKGAFYHHFSTKHDVFMALLYRWLGELDQQMLLMRAEGNTVPQQIQSMVSLARNVFAAAGDSRFALLLEFWGQAARDPATWQATIQPYYRYRDFFAVMVETGIAEGTLRPTDPATTARVILALAMGLFLQGLFDPAGANWEHVAQVGMETLLNGLRNHDSE
jgi:AcrR family transcriptional regulator